VLLTGIFALAVRGPRRGLPHLPVPGEFLQDAGRDRAQHIQRARDKGFDTQTAGLPVRVRE